MTPTRILALDLATVTGFALLGGGVITCGSQDFSRYPGSKSKPADHAGASFLRFSRWLADRIREDKPEVIVYEEVRRWVGFSAAHAFCGYRGLLYAHCAASGIPLVSYAASEVKKAFTGNGRAEKGQMMAEARRRHPELEIVDDNTADALAILALYMSRRGTV